MKTIIRLQSNELLTSFRPVPLNHIWLESYRSCDTGDANGVMWQEAKQFEGISSFCFGKLIKGAWNKRVGLWGWARVDFFIIYAETVSSVSIEFTGDFTGVVYMRWFTADNTFTLRQWKKMRTIIYVSKCVFYRTPIIQINLSQIKYVVYNISRRFGAKLAWNNILIVSNTYCNVLD